MNEKNKPWCPNGCYDKMDDEEIIKSFPLDIHNMAIGETVSVYMKCPICKNQIIMLITLEPTFNCWLDER